MIWFAKEFSKKLNKIKTSQFTKEQVMVAEEIIPLFLNYLEENEIIEFYVADFKDWIKKNHKDIAPFVSSEKISQVKLANPNKKVIDVQNCCYHFSRAKSFWIEDKKGKEIVPLEKLGSTHYKLKPNWKEELGIDVLEVTTIAKKILEVEQRDFTEETVFDMSKIEDERKKQLAYITKRQGQAEFRKKLLLAYSSKCAITGFDAEEAIEAAHIVPYLGERTNHITNGILLRADIHTLFDFLLLTIDPSSLEVVVSKNLFNTQYKELQGNPVYLPKDKSNHPNAKSLQYHFDEFMKKDNEGK